MSAHVCFREAPEILARKMSFSSVISERRQLINRHFLAGSPEMIGCLQRLRFSQAVPAVKHRCV